MGLKLVSAELLIYNIDFNKTDALGTPVATMALPEGTIACSSADFTATGSAIVYSQTALTGPQTNMYSLSSGTPSKTILASTTGDVTLRTDGRMYLSQAGQNSIMAYEQDMSSNYAVTLGTNLTSEHYKANKEYDDRLLRLNDHGTIEPSENNYSRLWHNSADEWSQGWIKSDIVLRAYSAGAGAFMLGAVGTEAAATYAGPAIKLSVEEVLLAKESTYYVGTWLAQNPVAASVIWSSIKTTLNSPFETMPGTPTPDTKEYDLVYKAAKIIFVQAYEALDRLQNKVQENKKDQEVKTK